MTKFLNISTDTNLGGSSASHEVVPSQKAIKTYVDNQSGGGGGLPDQTGNAGKFLTTDGTDASWGVVKTHNLFDFKWSDHELNDQSWLNANTFSWQDGTVYSDAYSHLVADYSGGTSQTETIGSHTITFVEATDGHRITTDESTVADIYTESGVAWFYVLDTTNQRFKLPRTKYGFNGVRDTVGKYIEAGLPNITGDVTNASIVTSNTSTPPEASGAFKVESYELESISGNTKRYIFKLGFDASESDSIYGNSTTVQPPATQMYLYFYVGQFSQSATEQTAGLNSSLFNGKVDLDFNNMNPSATAKQTIVGWGMPDYSTGISISLTNNVELEWTAPYNCFVRVSGSGSSGSSPGIARIRTKDDVDIVRVDIATSSVSCVGTFVAVGEKVKLYARSNSVGGIYYALKGN